MSSTAFQLPLDYNYESTTIIVERREGMPERPRKFLLSLLQTVRVEKPTRPPMGPLPQVADEPQ